jgi:hypothetical protein
VFELGSRFVLDKMAPWDTRAMKSIWFVYLFWFILKRVLFFLSRCFGKAPGEIDGVSVFFEWMFAVFPIA